MDFHCSASVYSVERDRYRLLTPQMNALSMKKTTQTQRRDYLMRYKLGDGRRVRKLQIMWLNH